jgi:hypothetical protein
VATKPLEGVETMVETYMLLLFELGGAIRKDVLKMY